MSNISQLAIMLHTLGCQKEHSDDMQELLKPRVDGVCYYYLEQSLASEDKPDTKYWTEEAQKLCEQLQASPVDAVRIVMALLEIRGKLSELLRRYPTAGDLARHVLFDGHS